MSEDPPDHTIIIEANIRAYDKKKSVSLDNFWRHRIITSCGDDRVTRGKQHVDPALCMYYGAKFICVMDNTALRERVPRGNGTMCRFRSIKLKPGASARTKIFHGRKVTTVNAKDVQYMVCEVIDNSSHIKQLSHRMKELSMKPRPNTKKIKTLQQQIETERKKKIFHMEPITATATVRCSVTSNTPPLTFKTRMTQFPINLADAVTGHKLQGRTLDKIIITGWGLSFMRNWEYTVLSQVKTRAGLFLLEELDVNKSYGASEQFRRFIQRLKKIEDRTINN
jgi:hypothetical protein